MNTVTNFDSAELLAEAAANYFVTLANECIEKKGKFTVALSGGNTPMALYKLLATPTFSNKLDWKKVFIFWGDERCVPLDSSDNNAFNAKNAFLSKIKIPTKNIFIAPVDETPVNAAIYYEATIKIFFKTDKPVFDLILLGMGDDGHTASLFPYTKILQEKEKIVSTVFVENKNSWRISFTETLINLATHKLFLVIGKDKKPMLDIILHGEKDIEKYPAHMIENAEWFVAV
jgi:6-phosphogluconolactonase